MRSLCTVREQSQHAATRESLCAATRPSAAKSKKIINKAKKKNSHFFQGHSSAFIMICNSNPEKKKSIVEFGLSPSRWIDGITKQLKMIP